MRFEHASWIPLRRLLAGCFASLASLSATASSVSAGSVPEELMAAAQANGSARAIVELRIRHRPEPKLSELHGAAAVATQRSQIAMAQVALEGEIGLAAEQVHHRYRSLPFVAISATPRQLALLRASRSVRSVVADALAPPALTTSTGVIGADDAWSAGYEGDDWSVAVLDTGVDSSHESLAGKVEFEACYSTNGSCPNGLTEQEGDGAGAPCDYASECDHGTHVASIAAGSGGGISGVAPEAAVLAFQVFSHFTAPSCGGAADCALSYQSDQIAALERVYELRDEYAIAAVNMSLGGGRYVTQTACNLATTPIRIAIDNLRRVGIATVIAAGNDGYVSAMSAPGCVVSAVGVGATSNLDSVASFSNASGMVDLYAPGVGITAAVPGGFAMKSGTSMATPHVAGAFAVMRSRNPSSSVSTTLSRLASTGLSVRDSKLTALVKRRIRLDLATANWTVSTKTLVRTPNGGTPVEVGEDVEIKWFQAPEVARVDLYYTPNVALKTNRWRLIASNADPDADGEYTWTVPSLPADGPRGRIWVRPFNAGGAAMTGDSSDADFVIDAP